MRKKKRYFETVVAHINVSNINIDWCTTERVRVVHFEGSVGIREVRLETNLL